MIPVSPRELHGNMPTVEAAQPQSVLQDGFNIPINYVLQALAACKGNNYLKDLAAQAFFPVQSTLPRAAQQQIATEIVPAAPVPVNPASSPISQTTAPPMVYLQDQPVSVYSHPIANGGSVQCFIFSATGAGNPGVSYQRVPGFPFVQNTGYFPVEVDSRQVHLGPVPDSQKRAQASGISAPYKSTRIKWSAEMSRDLESVYDSLLAARVRPTQRVVHEIMKEKYPFMTELHVQSKLQKLRQMKKTAVLQRAGSW